MSIHPQAIIDPQVELADHVTVGPFTMIQGRVSIGPGVIIGAGVHIFGTTTIGEGTEIYPAAVIGHKPQDTAYTGGETFLHIGKRNIIREHVTIHRATKEGTATEIGDDNFIMANAHIAHNCLIGNNTTIANGVLLGGHVTIDDQVFISGNSAAHQFTRVGRLAMIAGLSRVKRDVPPFMMVHGDSILRGLNIVGLRRAGLRAPQRLEIQRAYKTLFRSGLSLREALTCLENSNPSTEVQALITFIRASQRGISRP